MDFRWLEPMYDGLFKWLFIFFVIGILGVIGTVTFFTLWLLK